MSVRNQYAKNYYKISPMPLTSNQLANARNAVRRRNMYRGPDEADDTNNSGARSTSGEAEKKIPVTEVKSNRETVDLFHVRKSDRLKKGSDVTIYGKHELNKLVSKNSPNKANELIESKNSKAKNKEIKTDSYNQRSKPTMNDIAPLRPKSARPESRWERRVDDDVEYISDEELESNTSSVRPVSARPESRIVRWRESESISDRPKTGHGRRVATDGNSEQADQEKERHKEHKERPKSRMGDIKDTKESSAKSRDINLNLDKGSKHHQLQSIDNENDVVFNDTAYHVGISTFYPDLIDKIHGIDDINLQIDDIDRDVDPVLFFMQDNSNKPEKNAKRRASLSRDAISVITNEKNSRQSKATIGFQGNNQNKRNSVPEVIDRFHRNKILSLQNSIADDNPRHFNHGRHERIKSDSLIGNLAAGENIYKSSTNATNNELSTSHSVQRKKDTELGKQSSNYDSVSFTSQKYSIATTRKPRKLHPLGRPCLEE